MSPLQSCNVRRPSESIPLAIPSVPIRAPRRPCNGHPVTAKLRHDLVEPLVRAESQFETLQHSGQQRFLARCRAEPRERGGALLELGGNRCVEVPMPTPATTAPMRRADSRPALRDLPPRRPERRSTSFTRAAEADSSGGNSSDMAARTAEASRRAAASRAATWSSSGRSRTETSGPSHRVRRSARPRRRRPGTRPIGDRCRAVRRAAAGCRQRIVVTRRTRSPTMTSPCM